MCAVDHVNVLFVAVPLLLSAYCCRPLLTLFERGGIRFLDGRHVEWHLVHTPRSNFRSW